MAAFGAERKAVILPMDFRSQPGKGHSLYGPLTARLPHCGPLLKAIRRISVDGKPTLGDTVPWFGS